MLHAAPPAPWAGFRARFFAAVDAGDACAHAGDGAAARGWYAAAVADMAPHAGDAGTPLMRAMMAALRRLASAAPPCTLSAARAQRAQWAAMEERLEDDDY